MRSDSVNVKLESPQDLILVNTDVFFELLHLVLVEGLSPISPIIYNVVKTIA